MLIKDSKFEFFVDNKNVYAGADVHVEVKKDKFILETELGKTSKQKLKIIVTKMNYVEPIEDSTDKKKDTDE